MSDTAEPSRVRRHLGGVLALLVYAGPVLVPFYGFGYAWRFGHRLASLPYRDWPLRPDKYAAAENSRPRGSRPRLRRDPLVWAKPYQLCWPSRRSRPSRI